MYVKLWHTTGRPDYCIQYVLGLYTINSFVVVEGERKTFHDINNLKIIYKLNIKITCEAIFQAEKRKEHCRHCGKKCKVIIIKSTVLLKTETQPPKPNNMVTINTHTSIITLNTNGLNSFIKRHKLYITEP